MTENNRQQSRTFRSLLEELAHSARSSSGKGISFERLVKWFIERDKAQVNRFSEVWMWADWPGNNYRHDTGIDLVARERGSNNLVAIQCKFYNQESQIALENIKSFLTAYGEKAFSEGIIVSSTSNWTKNAENTLINRDKPVARWGINVFEESSIDWARSDLRQLWNKEPKQLREYQRQALNDTLDGFKRSGRGKLIMPCGSGKTFTALRIAERVIGSGGVALFLTPSISLLAQSLNDWTNDAELRLAAIPVCSDAKIEGREDSEDMEDISIFDMKWPASTDPKALLSRFRQAQRRNQMTVVFSTYQSLNVIAEAQRRGLPEFDLIICDEAHRTTGILDSESNFQQVHNDDIVASAKRLYMTATPRIYGDHAQRRAKDKRLTLASMDDEAVYGPEFHRLGFGKAIEMGILSDYKVVILDIDQEQVGIDLDSLLADGQSDVNMDNGARMVGCWNGLRKHADGYDFAEDPLPAKRAVAFSNRISESQLFERHFAEVIQRCIAADDDAPEMLHCEVRHVDGTQNALQRREKLNWLKAEPEAGVCRVLSNARCLTEGIDVPALDAILFLYPRRSEIDVVQAVGRVMRKAKGKKWGYIILPIARAPGISPQEAVAGSAYKAVWQVINAIAAHDDRFEARINQLKLDKESPPPDYLKDSDIATKEDENDKEKQIALHLIFSGLAEYRDAILAMIVDKYSNPRYWEQWAEKIRDIAQRHEARIRAMIQLPDGDVAEIFDAFLAGLRQSLNNDISANDAVSMLSQHLVIKPVFDALFSDYRFAARNPVAVEMQRVLDALQDRGLEKESAGLENLYRDVRIRAEGVTQAAGRQQLIAELYERFFKGALPDEVFKSLGIAYTPVEVVDYIIRSVEDILKAEFDASLGDEGVHIIDPFVGTGTFMTRLLQSGFIQPADLPRKYKHELHANELNLLAYYVAAVNIESTYHDAAAAEEYSPFPGIVLTDTFQSYEEDEAPLTRAWFPSNNQRIERQKRADIRVVIGNPPWSATNNRAYPRIDGRVKQSYSNLSIASSLNALYDPYVKAIRLASDRVLHGAKGGIVAFASNGGFIDSNSFDGFRKAVANEFDAIYVYNLRGNARLSGEAWRREGDKIFGGSSRATVALVILVKKPYNNAQSSAVKRSQAQSSAVKRSQAQSSAVKRSQAQSSAVKRSQAQSSAVKRSQAQSSAVKRSQAQSSDASIFYRDIGDYLSREEKLDILSKDRLATTEWEEISPNEQGDWINQRSDLWGSLRHLAQEGQNNKFIRAIFSQNTLGLVTSRDAWCFNSSQISLHMKIQSSIKFYNEQVDAFLSTRPIGTKKQRTQQIKSFVIKDETRFHWSHDNYSRAANGEKLTFEENNLRIASFRPFFKQHLYFSRELNSRIRQFPEIYPDQQTQNLGISITGLGSNVPFHVLVTNCIVEYCLTGVNTAYFPRYRYVQSLTGALERVSNINPAAVRGFRQHYADETISDDDIFYFTYGVLHSEQYRQTFANDLAKSAARIPMAGSLADFRAFADAGRKLADLHVNYETVDPYPLREIHSLMWRADAPRAYRVEKMKYAGKRPNLDKSTIIYNAGITLAGIPAKAHEYKLGTRSALDWLLDRYRVKTDKKSGITNDANDWADEVGDPRYMLDLIKRITTVSVETVDIVNGLPTLPI